MEATKEQAQRLAQPQKHSVEKVLVIVSKGTIEDVYAGMIMANGALMEGIEAKMFFTFFGMDAIRKDKQDKLHTATVGNPAMMSKVPTMIAGLPGMETLASAMMKKEMDKLDIPPVSEFLEMIIAGGGEIYACMLAAEMFHLTEDDFIDDLSGIITVGDMYGLAAGKGTQIIFI